LRGVPNARAPEPSTTGTSLPLWQLLGATARALGEVQSGHSSTQILKGLEARLKPGVQSLLFLALRQWGRASVIRSLLVSKKPPAAVDQLLCTALALVCASDVGPYEPHTLVNQAVEAAKKQLNTKPQAAFLNAVLRRFLREKEALMAVALRSELALYNHQDWWVAKLKKQYPKDWQDLLERAQTPPPMMLRVNASLLSRAKYLEQLQSSGLEAHEIEGTREGLVLKQGVRVESLPGFRQGLCSVQDGHAQWAAPLLLEAIGAHTPQEEEGSPISTPLLSSSSPSEPFTILDACAAPGGKTAHLLESLAAFRDWRGHGRTQLHALEIDEERAHSIELNLNRLGLWGPGQSSGTASVTTSGTANVTRLGPDSASASASALASNSDDSLGELGQSVPQGESSPIGQGVKACPTWVQLWVGDAAVGSTWRPLRRQRSGQEVLEQPPSFDAILLDAPCSASGIVRRHPDIRWLRREADIPQLVAQQKRLLNALWLRLKPGGILLYCTCSVFHEEGQGQIDSFLQHNSQATLLPSPGHLIASKAPLEPSLLDNRSSDQDGFYYAILQKNAGT